MFTPLGACGHRKSCTHTHTVVESRWLGQLEADPNPGRELGGAAKPNHACAADNGIG